MNAPVTTAGPGVRHAAPRASDAGRSHSAAPFASALDGALSENRASDRGVERRGMRDDRAAGHAAARDQRLEDRSRGAADRALDKADRTADRTEQAEERATRGADEKGRQDGTGTDAGRPVDDAPATDEVVPRPDESREAAGGSAEAPRGGLPALWALIMGGSLATPPAGETAPDAGSAPALPPVLPVPPAGMDVPVGAPAAGASPAPATAGMPVELPAAPGTAVPAVGPFAPVATATPAPVLAGEGLPAAFSGVLAETGAVVTAPAAPAAGTAPPVLVLPSDPAPDAASATDTAATEAPALAAVGAPLPADGEAEPAAPTPASGSANAVVPPAGRTSGDAPSADAGGAGRSTGDDAVPPTGTTGQPLGPTAAGATPTTAAAADVDGATGPVPTPPVGSQVARQVAVLSGSPDGDHSMTLVLTPETLGEVKVQVTLSKGSIELALRGAHEHGRAALLDALPELRRELEAAGLNPSRLEVSRDTGSASLDRQPTPHQGSGERGGQPDRGEDRSRPWGRPADTGGSGTSAPQNRSTSSGVDVLA